MHDHKNDEKVPTETLELLYAYRTQFEKQINFSKSRKDRLEKLLVRRSAGRWSPEKRERMVRRHSAAVTQYEQGISLLSQVNSRIEQKR